eukprot:1159597-Pelagomonas_calceolata.AAC.11
MAPCGLEHIMLALGSNKLGHDFPGSEEPRLKESSSRVRVGLRECRSALGEIYMYAGTQAWGA